MLCKKEEKNASALLSMSQEEQTDPLWFADPRKKFADKCGRT
jgi:hypothetical protein